MRSVFVNSPPPKPEVILTNFFAEPTVLLVPITSRGILWCVQFAFLLLEYCRIRECYAVANAFTIRNMYSLLLYMNCNSRKINRPTKNIAYLKLWIMKFPHQSKSLLKTVIWCYWDLKSINSCTVERMPIVTMLFCVNISINTANSFAWKCLFSISKTTGAYWNLYPTNRDYACLWLKRGVKKFKHKAPLELMLSGETGMKRVWHFLDCTQGWRD
jgi:hypothetical protein